MTPYDTSDPVTKERSILGTRVYMASHPKMRSYFRGENRPAFFGDKVWETTLSVIRQLSNESFGRVVELGCGWGVLGVHLARTTGARVLCVDRDPRLEPIVELQAELNEVEVEYRAARFHELQAADLRGDAVIGVEICYSKSVAAELTELMEKANQARVGRVILADPGRPDFDRLVAYSEERFETEIAPLPIEGRSKPGKLLTVRF